MMAAFLRLLALPSLAIEHFDEGIYASNIWFGPENNFEFPARAFYAPPLWPMILEWWQIIGFTLGMTGGTSPDQANSLAACWPILPGIAFGVATVGLVWVMGLLCFDRATALMAGLLAMVDPLHVAYSQTALTDVPVTFWILLAVGLLVLSLSRQSWPAAIGAAVVTSIAWSTKYSGWLPLAILWSGLVAGFLVQRLFPTREDKYDNHGEDEEMLNLISPSGVSIIKGLNIAGVITVLAIVCWSPVLWSLQKDGGYSAISANQARYVTGVSQWGYTLLDVLDNDTHYASFGTAAVNAAVMAIVFAMLAWRNPSDRDLFRCQFLLLGISFFGGATIPNLVGILLSSVVLRFVFQIARKKMPPLQFPRTDQFWAIVFLIVWTAGLFSTIPLYRSYPRLIIPLLPPLWLLGAASLSTAVRWARQARLSMAEDTLPTTAERSRPWQRPWYVTGVAALVSVIWIAAAAMQPRLKAEASSDHIETTIPQAAGPWQDRKSVLRTAVEFAGIVRGSTRGNTPAIVYIYAEPAMLWGLRWAGIDLVGPVQDFGFVRTPTPADVWLVTGPHATRDAAFAQQWEPVADRFIQIGERVIAPSDIVLLDEQPAGSGRQRPSEQLILWKMKTP